MLIQVQLENEQSRVKIFQNAVFGKFSNNNVMISANKSCSLDDLLETLQTLFAALVTSC